MLTVYSDAWLRLCVAAFLLFTATSCSWLKPDWHNTVPSTLFVFQNVEQTGLATFQQGQAVEIYQAFSDTKLASIKSVLDESQQPWRILGFGINPVKRDAMTTIWWIQAPEKTLGLLSDAYRKKGGEMSYEFMGERIHRLSSTDGLQLHAVQWKETLILSRSGFGVEEAIRTGKGKVTPLLAADKNLPGGIYLNAGAFGRLLPELADVRFARKFDNLFQSFPVMQVVTANPRSNQLWQADSYLQLPSTLAPAMQFLQQPAFKTNLDALVSADAAAWAFIADQVTSLPQAKNDTLAYFLTRNPEVKQLLLTGLGMESGWAAFTAAGLNASSEDAFFRSVKDSSRVKKGLQQLLEAGLIYENGDGSLVVGSAAMGRLFGGPWCGWSNFFLRPLDKGFAISINEGLLRRLSEDQRRAKVLQYDETFLARRPLWPERVTAVFGVNTARYFEYLSTSLNTRHQTDVLFRQAPEMLFFATPEGGRLKISAQGYPAGARANDPVQERWLFALGENEDLTAPPVFVDVKGSARPEVLFATSAGNVVALAADGTAVFQASTLPEKPVGAPVVTDWYNNRTKSIIIAAGERLYGWSLDGKMLPKFPLDINERIIAPLVIADVNRDKSPEAIVSVESNKIKIVNSRGNTLFGWPQNTGMPVFSAPLFYVEQLDRMIWAFAENRVSGWFADGSIIANTPVILNASLSGSPLPFNDRILGSGLDGHLYVIGNPLFPLNADAFTKAGKPMRGVQAIYISDGGLVGTPQALPLKLTDEQGTASSITAFLVQSLNGTVYLIGPDGSTLFAQSMGQPANEQQVPVAADLDGDGTPEILAVAEYGRLFAWSIQTQQRILDLPTAAIQVLGVVDFENDKKIELVAKTEEGVRCWTIALQR